jgi:hypothetical protein
LKTSGERAWQEQNGEIANETNNVVDQDEDTLVETSTVGHFTPKHGYRSADEDFKKQHDDVVERHQSDNAVDPSAVDFEWGEHPREEKEDGGFRCKGHRAVVDHRSIDHLGNEN